MSKTLRIVRRAAGDPQTLPPQLPAILRRLYAARGARADEIALDLPNLLPPDGLRGIGDAAVLLADAIAAQRRIVIAGDYDCDGATACAVGCLGLRLMGASSVDFVVPDRFRMGYGLSPALVDLACARGAQVLVTVDNGIASVAGVAHAKARGLTVLITDHHLPGPVLPAADAIVNPNQPGCSFASKSMAGVGVMFYVLLALRAELRRRGVAQAAVQLSELLDLVALGTVADVVCLDHNNRILVEQGLRRMRAGRLRPGLRALLTVAGRSLEHLSATDLGFVLGPRLNAAGRLDNMGAGIECLLADSLDAALPLARELDRLNRERRTMTTQMADEALQIIADTDAVGICVFQEDWHEGIVGLVATRLKEAHHRPAIAFSRAQEAGLLKGSARSIAGLHVRDALATIDARHPGLIERFGGHAMAAGLTLHAEALAPFTQAFDVICREWLPAAALQRTLETDGEIPDAELTLSTVQSLELAGPWGQGFPEPLFEGQFDVLACYFMGQEKQHVRYRLRGPAGQPLEAVDFGGAVRAAKAGLRIGLVYQPGINRYNGQESLQMRIVDLRPV